MVWQISCEHLSLSFGGVVVSFFVVEHILFFACCDVHFACFGARTLLVVLLVVRRVCRCGMVMLGFVNVGRLFVQWIVSVSSLFFACVPFV